MKIKLLTGLAGDRFSHAPGEVIELPEEEAQRFIDKELAEPVEASDAAAATKRADAAAAAAAAETKRAEAAAAKVAKKAEAEAKKAAKVAKAPKQ
jgi:hypothetical protein